MHDLVIRAHELLIRAHDLICAHGLIICAHGLVIRVHGLVINPSARITVIIFRMAPPGLHRILMIWFFLYKNEEIERKI